MGVLLNFSVLSFSLSNCAAQKKRANVRPDGFMSVASFFWDSAFSVLIILGSMVTTSYVSATTTAVRASNSDKCSGSSCNSRSSNTVHSTNRSSTSVCPGTCETSSIGGATICSSSVPASDFSEFCFQNAFGTSHLVSVTFLSLHAERSQVAMVVVVIVTDKISLPTEDKIFPLSR